MLDLSKGTRLAERYTLERSLGSGGEATTWLAKDRLTRAQVALKIVPANSGANARLHDEWQTNLRLMHAHIVRVFEFHEDQGAAFYSMQFVDGADFGVLTGSPLADLLPPVGLVAEALRYAHGKNIVHRDIKASNVLLDFNGAPYLSDFGVAAPVGSLAAGGSPIAASPGALRGEAVQPADDIFALGKLIYELISGAPPQAKSDAVGGPEFQTLIAASGEDVPAAIRDLVASMLEDDAGKRPDAEGVVDALRQAGFPPGAARSQITARPVVSDERIESVAAVRRSPTPAAGQIGMEPAESAGISPRTLGIGLAVLAVALLGVVFLLPAVTDKKSGPTNTRLVPEASTSAGESPAVADIPDENDMTGGNRVTREYVPENTALDGETIEFNENDADYTDLDDSGKLRYKVDMILGELLSDFETLERRAVQRWAAVAYRRAQDFYKKGDDAYLRKEWAAAEVHYLDALSVLEPLFDQVEPEFQKALTGASVAFEAGDRAEALRLFELAVAITPNSPAAREGYERAKNLETVLQLVDQGLEYEEELELDAAEASFQQAVDLDPDWVPAQEGVDRVRITRTKIQFDSRMSEGIEALAIGDYLGARAAFRMAEQLIPGSPEPADGLLQVDQGLRLDNINTLEQEALALERSEHWDAAAKTYEEILKVDSNLSFAMDGLAKSHRMSELHMQLDDYIKDPDRLAVPSVMKRATTLLVNVTRMAEIGPRLEGQRDELSRLLKRAATPVSIELVSDNLTSVSIYKVGVLGNFANTRLDLPPGTYVAVGVRPGYRDVRLEFRVAPEIDMQPVVVQCEEPI
ncbi:MAG: protein kinase [Chromatiales bacterium]|nr:protein kinase [Chromatiales bacterium]